MQKISSMAASALVLSACAAPPTPPTEAAPQLGLANPASVFCLQQGGKLRRVTTAAGEHGICVLPDGREVDEWAYFRQHHRASP